MPLEKESLAIPRERTRTPARVVVIGAGIAGIAAVESLRNADSSVKISLISRETVLPYYRLNLTRYLAGEIKRENLPVHPTRWYEERYIELMLGEVVAALEENRPTMNPLVNAVLGVVFLLAGLAATILIYFVRGYPHAGRE